jgi:hypothetical protein
VYISPLFPDENGTFISLNAAASTFFSAHLSGMMMRMIFTLKGENKGVIKSNLCTINVDQPKKHQ